MLFGDWDPNPLAPLVLLLFHSPEQFKNDVINTNSWFGHFLLNQVVIYITLGGDFLHTKLILDIELSMNLHDVKMKNQYLDDQIWFTGPSEFSGINLIMSSLRH